MTSFEGMWKKIVGDKRYREEFAIAMLKRMVSLQIRAIRKRKLKKTQAELAELANIEQGVISRAENPDLGLTLNTIGRIAAGFDMAFIGTFVPFSKLVRFSETLSETELASIRNCVEENEALERGESLEASSEIGNADYPQPSGLAKLPPEREAPLGSGNVLELQQLA